MRGLLERLIFTQREHYYRLVAVACDDNGRVVLADAVDRLRKIFSGRGVSDRLHSMDRILSSQRGTNYFAKKIHFIGRLITCRNPVRRQK